MQRNVLPKCCYQMRIGYITYYNTPDNLRISLEENLIEISAKNSQNHKLRINTNTFVLIALQCNAASYVMSSHQCFSCPVWYTECQSSSSASLDHTENPCALTDPPAIVLAFVTKHGLVNLDRFSSAAQLQVAM